MDTEMNFEVSRIKTEVIHLQQNGVLEYGEQYVIFTIPESIIKLLSEFREIVSDNSICNGE